MDRPAICSLMRFSVRFLSLRFEKFSDEVTLDYVLEGLPILICCYLFLISHPSNYIPSDRSILLHPEQAVVKDVEGAGTPLSSTGTPDSDKVVEK